MFFPSVKSQAQEEVEWQAAPKPEAKLTEVVAESFGSGREMSLSGAVADYFSVDYAELNTPELVNKDEANALTKDYGITFDQDVSRGELDWHIERSENKLRRERVLGSVKDNFFKRAAGFVTEMGAAGFDPAEIALGSVVGAGVRLGARSIEATSRAMSVAKLAEKGGYAAKFADAFFGNVTSEMIIAGTSNNKKEEYGIDQAILNATIGTALISGTMFGASKLFKTIGKLKEGSLNELTKTSEDLISIGKSPAHVIDAVDKAVEKADIIDDGLSAMITKNFPEEAESMLKMTASEAVAVGKKSPAFVQELSNSELRQKAWLNDDASPSDFLVKEEADALSAKLDSEESDFGYDRQEVELRNSIPEEVEEVIDMSAYNEKLSSYKAALTDADSISQLDNLDLETKDLISDVAARKELLNCRKGFYGN